MKIALVSDQFPPYTTGGASSVAFNHAKGLIDRGYEVTVFTITGNVEEVGVRQYEGVSVHYFYSKYHPRLRWWYYALFHRRLLRLFKKELAKIKPEVVHFHNVHSHFSYAAIKVATLSGAKVFVTLHDVMQFSYAKLTDFINPHETHIPEYFNYRVPWWIELMRHRFRYNPFRNLIIKHYLRYATKLFAVSNALKEAHEQNGIGNIEVIHNGIDLASWEKPSLSAPAFLGELTDKNIIFLPGRIIEEKGPQELLKAVNLVATNIKNLVVLFVGPRVEDAWVTTMIANSGVSEVVKIYPAVSRDAIKAVYQASTVVVSPSVCFDSFPTVNIEAMAAKKPVITSCFGGGREAVLDGVTGYVVNPYNTADFGAKLEMLLSDQSHATSMGKVGYTRVEQHFTINQQIDSYEGFYK